MSDRNLLPLASYSDEVMPFLASQYRNAKNLQAIVETMNVLALDAEKASFEIRDRFWLSTATGVQLDIIGSLYGVARAGRADEPYRQVIRFRSLSGYSGTPEELISFLITGLGAAFVEFVPEWIAGAVPAQFVVRTDIGIDYDVLQDLAPAGVLGLQGFFLLDALGAPIRYGLEENHRIMHVGAGVPAHDTEYTMIGDTLEEMQGSTAETMIGVEFS